MLVWYSHGNWTTTPWQSKPLTSWWQCRPNKGIDGNSMWSNGKLAQTRGSGRLFMPHLLDTIITVCPSLDWLVENLSAKTTIFCHQHSPLQIHHQDQDQDQDQTEGKDQTSGARFTALVWCVHKKGTLATIVLGQQGNNDWDKQYLQPTNTAHSLLAQWDGQQWWVLTTQVL